MSKIVSKSLTPVRQVPQKDANAEEEDMDISDVEEGIYIISKKWELILMTMKISLQEEPELAIFIFPHQQRRTVQQKAKHLGLLYALSRILTSRVMLMKLSLVHSIT